MATIRSLAREFNVHPYGLAAYLNLGVDYAETAELDATTEALYREQWAAGQIAECGHPLSAYCACFADAMEAELDADYGPDDALRATFDPTNPSIHADCGHHHSTAQCPHPYQPCGDYVCCIN